MLSPADGSKYRDQQPDSMQRVRNLRILSPKRDVSIKSHAPPNPGLREPCGRGVRKGLRTKGEGGHQEYSGL